MLKTLVVYYSRTGNTKKLAEQIAKVSEADLFQVKPVTPFPTDMYQTSDLAKRQYETGQLPNLTAVPDITKYQRIIIGSPVWSGRIATPIASFLTKVTLSEIPTFLFGTFASDAGNFVSDFLQQSGTNSQHHKSFIRNSKVSDKQISDWLSN